MRTPLSILGILLIAVPAAAQEPPAPAPPPPVQAAPEPAPAPPPAPPPPAPAPSASALDVIGALIQQTPAPVVGNTVQAPVFPEEMTPPGDPNSPNAMRFALHGYFRAPLRLGFRPRTGAMPGEASKNIHTPWLVDDDFFQSGFLYTRIPESDFTELYFMAGNTYLTGVVGLAGSLYSDPARPIIDKQQGISQGYLVYRYNHDFGSDVHLRIGVKGGAFSDRFGWQEHYDTYLFGRTHQIGEQVRADFDAGKWTFSAMEGFGAHLEAIESNQGLSLLDYFRLGASYDRTAELSLYYLRTWTQDKRQLKDIADGSMRVMGVEARVDSNGFGKLQADVSVLSADQASWLAPSIEVMHSAGGRGITQNYLGTEKSNNGTGSLLNVGWQYDLSARQMLKRVLGHSPMGEADAVLSLFGVYTKVGSDQKDPDPLVNKDGVQMLKWGAELDVWPLSFLGASFRYDRVIPDIRDDASAFRVFTPRLILRAHWFTDAQLYLQYSHYQYGSNVTLRQGQVPLETLPDKDVVKIQAQLVF